MKRFILIAGLLLTTNVFAEDLNFLCEFDDSFPLEVRSDEQRDWIESLKDTPVLYRINLATPKFVYWDETKDEWTVTRPQHFRESDIHDAFIRIPGKHYFYSGIWWEGLKKDYFDWGLLSRRDLTMQDMDLMNPFKVYVQFQCKIVDDVVLNEKRIARLKVIQGWKEEYEKKRQEELKKNIF